MGGVALKDAALAEISKRARPYPAHLLTGLSRGLVLFAAAFEGHNDAIHFARKRLETTCVDVDHDKLAAMADRYPREWDFLVDDAWKFAAAARDLGETWDAVSVDTFLGDATERSMTTLDLWCSLARKVVTCTCDDPKTRAPDGWSTSFYPRAPGVYWLVMTR